MKHTAKIISIAVIISILYVFAPAEAVAVVLPGTAKLVPPETILLVEVDNFSQLKSQFEKTNLYKLYKDPEMAAFFDDLKSKWRKKIQEMDGNNIFKMLLDIDVLPRGRVAMALGLDEQTKNANEPSVVFISQWGENINKVKEAVKKMLEKNAELGGHRKGREEYRGVIIETMVDEGSAELIYCYIDDCMILATNPDVVKFVIAHLKGATSPTLADDTDYTGTIAALGPLAQGSVEFCVNIKQIIKMIIAENTAGQARTFITNLGFDNVAAFGCSVSPGSSSHGRAFLKIDGAKKGICKMLEPETAVIKAPGFIPASAYSATFFNLNIKKAYDELGNILNRFSPQLAAIMYMPLLPASPDGEPGLELKKDIIEHLGSQIVLAQTIKKPFTKTSTPTQYLVSLAVANHRALEKSLSLLHSKTIAQNNPDAKRELLGHTIYVVSLPKFPLLRPGMIPMQDPAEISSPQMQKLAFTITDTHLILGTESGVEQAIRTLSSSAAASMATAKWFNSAKSAIPSVVGLAGLQDDAALSEFFWWMMKESGKAKDSNASIGVNPFFMFSQMGFDLFNFGLLPEFDAVRKYFGVSVSYGVSRPDGFFFEFKDINPDGTD